MQARQVMLVIDAGTTGVRAVAVSSDTLEPIHSVYERIPDEYIRTPHSGWVELDPEGLWSVTRAVVERTLAKVGPVQGIALTTQRSSVLLTDDKGTPLTPLVPWQDTRSAELCDQANASAMLKTIQGSSGLLHFVSRSPKFKAGSVWTFSPIMACTRVCWLLRNDKKLAQLATEGKLLYGGLDSWLLHKLIDGPWQTDRSNLSAAGFYDPWTDGPSSLVFSLLSVPNTLFTRCDKASASHWGTTRKDLFGGAEIPLLTVVSDQGAAVAGECCFEAGEAKITMGSGAFFSVTTGRASKGSRGGSEVQYPSEGVYPLVAFEIGPETTYMVEGSEPACGTGLDWVGKAFGLWDDVRTTSAVASSVSDTQGVTFVPSLFGLRAPHNHNKSKGAFIGLTTAATRSHLVRAVLESVAWRLFELLQCINAGPTKVKSIRIGGGVSHNDFVCQFFADLAGMPVHRGHNVEVTVTGAAILAGIAAGWYAWTPDGKAALRKLTQSNDTVFLPTMNREEVGKRFLLWTDACDRVKMQ